MKNERRLLVVEDEQTEIDSVTRLATGLKISCLAVKTLAEAFSALDRESFDYLLTDLHIGTKSGEDRPDGLQVIAYAREQQPNIVIVANSSDPRADVWKEALQSGAQQFIRKPLIKADELVIAFGLAKERKTLTQPRNPLMLPGSLWANYASTYPEGIVIDKTTLSKVRGLAKYKATTTTIAGETGTGKEELAKLIHKFRSEAEGAIPFVAVNCATITENLAESILFGHRKGAFTGADKTTQGCIGDADGGILFLDEIHALEMKVQKKLLRVLNDGSYSRLGESLTLKSEFQLIAATTKDPDDEVDAGNFLIDLRNRIQGIDIQLKPLRERPEDIEPLVALYLSRKDFAIGKIMFQDLTNRLKKYYWRGNVRQLFKALEAWLLNSEFNESPLNLDDFPVFKGMIDPEISRREKYSQPDESYSEENITGYISKSLAVDCDFERSIELYEKAMLKNALSRHRTVGDCCKAINIARSTMDSRRRKYGLLD